MVVAPSSFHSTSAGSGADRLRPGAWPPKHGLEGAVVPVVRQVGSTHVERGCALGDVPGVPTKMKVGSGSIDRRISQAQAARST